MSCSPFDLRDYFFGELSPNERSATETHITACSQCRDELAKVLEMNTLLLSAAPDEEPPHRIAFVSDKVFEPRWWQRLWTSGPQLGFAGAALVADAILVHGALARPVTSALPAPAAAAVSAPAPKTDLAAIQAEVDRRVQAEVARVVAARESDQLDHVLDVVNAKLQRVEHRNSRDLLLIREYLERLDKRNARVQRAMFNE